jgi:para-aminobenzoate synthetase
VPTDPSISAPEHSEAQARPLSEGQVDAGSIDPRVVVSSLGRMLDPARTFRALFGSDPFAFWIDREAGAGSGGARSIMGSAALPGSEVLAYEVGSGTVRSHSASGAVEHLDGTIFDILRRRLARRKPVADPRFDFAGGYVGYLGYELKSDLGSPGRHSSALPDACLIYSPGFVVFDHETGEAHAIRIVGPGEERASAEAEAMRMRNALAAIEEPDPVRTRTPSLISMGWDLGHDGYLAAITEAQRRLRAGESYEVCLTNRFGITFDQDPDPLDLYLRLRRLSQAPQAGFFRFGDAALLSASPEQFLRIDSERRVTTSPIKGTRPRGSDPESDRILREELSASAKERAENVMIVDVLRNDLGRVCEFGSIEVEQMAQVESFPQVHQLVSRISGRLAPGLDAVDCLEACFPGGSMTGAPKLRAMEILDSLETSARGPYSGAFGWFGPAGAADLSIVIRSIVLDGATALVGAGGAITVLSEPEAEYEEMLLKAGPLLELLGSPPPDGPPP